MSEQKPLKARKARKADQPLNDELPPAVEELTDAELDETTGGAGERLHLTVVRPTVMSIDPGGRSPARLTIIDESLRQQ